VQGDLHVSDGHDTRRRFAVHDRCERGARRGTRGVSAEGGDQSHRRADRQGRAKGRHLRAFCGRGRRGLPGAARRRRDRAQWKFPQARRAGRGEGQGLQPPARPEGFSRQGRACRRRRGFRDGGRHRARRLRGARHAQLPREGILPRKTGQRRNARAHRAGSRGRGRRHQPGLRAGDDGGRLRDARRRCARLGDDSAWVHGARDSRRRGRAGARWRGRERDRERRGFSDARARGAARVFSPGGRAGSRGIHHANVAHARRVPAFLRVALQLEGALQHPIRMAFAGLAESKSRRDLGRLARLVGHTGHARADAENLRLGAELLLHARLRDVRRRLWHPAHSPPAHALHHRANAHAHGDPGDPALFVARDFPPVDGARRLVRRRSREMVCRHVFPGGELRAWPRILARLRLHPRVAAHGVELVYQ